MGIKSRIIHALGGYTDDDAVPKIKRKENNPLWWAKGMCPFCFEQKIEWLSDAEYERKYPAIYDLSLGPIHTNICEYHARQLKDVFNRTIHDEEVE